MSSPKFSTKARRCLLQPGEGLVGLPPRLEHRSIDCQQVRAFGKMILTFIALVQFMAVSIEAHSLAKNDTSKCDFFKHAFLQTSCFVNGALAFVCS